MPRGALRQQCRTPPSRSPAETVEALARTARKVQNALRRGHDGLARVGIGRTARAVSRRVRLLDPLDPEYPGTVAPLSAVGARHPRPGRLGHAAQAVDARKHRRRRDRGARRAVPCRPDTPPCRLFVRRSCRRAGVGAAQGARARADPDRRCGPGDARRPARAVRQGAHGHERGRNRRRLPAEPGRADVCRSSQDRRARRPPAGGEHQAGALSQPPLRRNRRFSGRARRRHRPAENHLGHARHHRPALAGPAARHPAPAPPRTRKYA